MLHILKFHFATMEYDKGSIWRHLSFIVATCNSSDSMYKVSGTFLNSK